MKKLFAILMIAVHLFNVAGYKLLFNYYISRSDNAITQQLDAGSFTDTDLIEVKVKLNLPYMTTLENYERFDGEITVDGQYYKYVKRKVSNDTLYLLCLQDNHKSNLVKEKNDFGSTVNDLTTQNKNKDAGNTKLKKDNTSVEYSYQLKQPETTLYSSVVNEFTNLAAPHLTGICADAIDHPPNALG